jgi:hypothetical protein
MYQLIIFATIAIIVATIPAMVQSQTQNANIASIDFRRGLVHTGELTRKAPAVVSGDNIYIVWFLNKTGNDEVLFRSSNDGGTTFTDKINLSNSTAADSQDAEIAANGDNVVVTWWERNATTNEPVARISSDGGASFGPLLMLSTNGTIGEAGG